MEIQWCLLKLTFKGEMDGAWGGKRGGVGKKEGGLKIIGLQGFFSHCALSWLVDWVPVWRGLVIKDGICSRRVPESNANFCSLSPKTLPPPDTPRPPAFLSLMLKEIFIVSHISYSLCSLALTTFS